ncbi:hypothetical protein [Nostocoides jenkinsii]|uniref:Uncharacterized protein n=1 Tax=Nostocoides jenkinsii Ben 74 TaxID=1193518 RepID=A0A077MAG3_9MICO|nr:hypothetical protein [Tetrasphaera jenkinsii]CCI54356.1 hypothetical protein BN13_680038 [Tetrasphaera jenkinsii Ben 74]
MSLGRRLTWPREQRTAPLVSPSVLRNGVALIAGVVGICWFSFSPAPNYPLLVAILVLGWIVVWMLVGLSRSATAQHWVAYRPVSGRRPGRDSRVSQLRVLLDERDDADRNDEVHALLVNLTDDRLALRRADRPGEDEDRLALLGAELHAYLIAPSGARSRTLRDLDHYLARLERL